MKAPLLSILRANPYPKGHRPLVWNELVAGLENLEPITVPSPEVAQESFLLLGQQKSPEDSILALNSSAQVFQIFESRSEPLDVQGRLVVGQSGAEVLRDFDILQDFQARGNNPCLAEALVCKIESSGGAHYWKLRASVYRRTDNGDKIFILRWESLSHLLAELMDWEKFHREEKLALEARALFLANISHEIRTPMNAIIGMAYLLSKTPLSMDQAEYIEKLDGSAKSLLRIINDVLDFSKIEAGKMTIEAREFSMQSLIEEVFNLIRIPAEEKGLRIFCEVDPDIYKFLIGDDLRIKQILTNLTNNSVKFTDNGFVALKVYYRGQDPSGGHQLKFEVEDSGIGLSKEEIGKVFSPFVQADAKATRRNKGTGLGLSISKALIELMGGKVSIESEKGKGTKISFELKMKSTSQERLVDSALAIPPKKWIWFIEPNGPTEENLKKNLNRLHINPHWATSATDFVSRFSAECAALGSDVEHFIFVDRRNWAQDSWRHFLVNFKQSFGQKQGHLQFIILTDFSHSQMTEDLGEAVAVDAWMIRPIFTWTWKRQIDDLINAQWVHRKETRKRAPEKGKFRLEGRHILLVEDNEVNRLVGRDILTKAGAAVSIANDGLEAVELFDEKDVKVDAVLMDLQMPRLDGIEATKRIRALKHCKDLPIIALTANALPEERTHCLQQGMNDYLTKPIEPEILLKTLSRWCNPQIEEIKEFHLKDEEGAPPIVDWDLALKNVANNQNLLFEMAEKFLNDYGASAQTLRHSLNEGNFVQAQRLILSVKAVCGYLGAQALRGVAEELETAIKENQGELMSQSWVRFDEQMRRTLIEIQSYLKSRSGQPIR